MKLLKKHSATGVILRVKIIDSSSSSGAGKTGLTHASSGLIISTIASNEATPTAYTVTGSTIETIATLGTYAAPTATKCRFKEVDATNHPGLYELHLADARFAVSGAKSLIISLSGGSGMSQCDCEIQFASVDPLDTIAESYAAAGSAPTHAQILYAIHQALAGKRAISGETLNVYKLDGSTPALVFDLDDGNDPTSLTRSG